MTIYNTQTKTYHDLLHINGKNDIHTLNIQILMAGIYSCLNYYNQKGNHYNLRRKHLLKLSKCRTKTYGLSAAAFKDAIIWDNLPNYFVEAKSLPEVKL